MNLRTLALSALAACAILMPPAHVRAAGTTPALDEFDAAFAKINDYAFQLHSHETLGNGSQTRVYQYYFMKPHFAKTLIVSGDGQGSGGVWAGSDQVSGHQGGFLSAIHLKIDLHDHRATSLRGYTIPDGLVQNIIDRYRTVPGELSQHPGPRIAGEETDEVLLKVADPAGNGGVAKMIVYLSKVTHWPLREIFYDTGNNDVLDQTFTDVKTNTGLTQNDFPF